MSRRAGPTSLDTPLFGDPLPTAWEVPVAAHTRRVRTPVPEPLTRSTDPETSRQGPTQPDATERAILDVFAGWLELTDDELVRALPLLYGPTVKSARSRLARAGRLHDSGQRRLSARGRKQIVWRLSKETP